MKIDFANLPDKNDLYHELNLRKKTPINLINNLIGRELGTNSSALYLKSTRSEYSNRSESLKFTQLKRVYLTIYPNYSILNVKIPNCCFRKFSPDGKYLIGFNHNLTGVQIFRFNGCSSAINDINDLSQDDASKLESLKANVFERFFTEIVNQRFIDPNNINNNREQFHRECILFYKSTHLIVASSSVLSEDQTPPFDQLATNNESILYSIIENYTIYLIEIKTGRLCDKIEFKADKINLAHNQSFSLFQNLFAILSQQNQAIHLYYLIESHDGKTLKFELMLQIGRFCFSDDENFLNDFLIQNHTKINPRQVPSYEINNSVGGSNSSKGFADPCFTSLKQRVISFFYRQAIETNTLGQFYSNFNNLKKLKMYKMQLLDRRHLLIKYINLDHLMFQKNQVNLGGQGGTNASTQLLNRNQLSTTTTTTTTTTTAMPGPSISNNIPTPPNPTNNLTSLFTAPPNMVNIMTTGVSTDANNVTTTSITTILPAILNENSVPFYFVLYDIEKAEIINILSNSSEKLFDIFEQFQDFFSLNSLDGASSSFQDPSNRAPSSFNHYMNHHTLASNNQYANQTLKRHLKNLLRMNSVKDMTKCLLANLPIGSQTYSISPYLNQSLFSYDDRLVSNLDRPKPTIDQYLNFNMRENGRLAFRISLGVLQSNNSNQTNNGNQAAAMQRRLVAFIWHPREPFCISIQRGYFEFSFNFHVYSKQSNVQTC
jgi:hypothetical protein